MKKRTVLTTVVAVLLLVAVVAAGINAVFTVTSVNADFVTYTEEGERAAQALKESLNGYLGKSTTFLDLGEVRATAASDPRFQVVSVRKEYPASVVVELRERRAAFACRGEDGWDVYDVEGIRIGTDEEAGTYVRIEGDFALTSEAGVLTGKYAGELLGMYAVFCELLGEPRANFVSVELEDNSATGTDEFDRFRIATGEGVEIVLRGPSERIEDKARAAAQKYLSLEAHERVRGRISVVIEAESSLAVADYDPNAV